jgi:hypothetical protein
MNALHVSPLLRFALRLDAVATLVTGAAMAGLAGTLETLLHLPAALLTAAGLFCLVYAAVIGALSLRDTLPRWAVWTLVIGNALWALDCALLTFAGGLSPNAWGVSFLLVQALIVFGFAELQYVGMKRSALVA